MSTTPQDARKAEQKAGKDDLVRYVEDLAGPDDAWISLTDAARITRTSFICYAFEVNQIFHWVA